MKKRGGVPSGSGINDDSDIHESILMCLIGRSAGTKAVYFVPATLQHDRVDNRLSTLQPELESVLTESARLAYGHALPLSEADLVVQDSLIATAKSIHVAGTGSTKWSSRVLSLVQ